MNKCLLSNTFSMTTLFTAFTVIPLAVADTPPDDFKPRPFLIHLYIISPVAPEQSESPAHHESQSSQLHLKNLSGKNNIFIYTVYILTYIMETIVPLKINRDISFK